MSKTLLCLSGWAQKHDSLEIVFTNSSIKNDYKIYSLDYSNFDSVDDFFQKLKKITRKILIIEWCTSFKDDPNYSKKIFKENLAKYFSLIKKIEKNIYIAFK